MTAVHGAWGVGKTHLTRNVLEEGRRDYVYVSLFGVKSLSDMKDALIAQYTSDNSEGRAGFFSDVLKELGEAADKLGALGSISRIGVTMALAELASKRILFVDDLERRSESLALSDVLGYLANLREQKDAKIILAYNHDMLSEVDRAYLAKHREKAIDFSVEFPSVPAYAIEIGLENVKGQGIEFPDDSLRKALLQVGADNIRVIEKIARMTYRLAPPDMTIRQEVRANVSKATAILGWLKLSKEADPELWDFTRSFSYIHKFSRTQNVVKDSEPDERKKKLDAFAERLSGLGYTGTGVLESLVMSALDQGLYSNAAHQKILDDLDVSAAKLEASTALSDAWGLFRNHFTCTAEEFADRLKLCFETYSHYY